MVDTAGVLPQGASQRGQHLRNKADSGGTDSQRQTAGSGGGSSGGGSSRDGTGMRRCLTIRYVTARPLSAPSRTLAAPAAAPELPCRWQWAPCCPSLLAMRCNTAPDLMACISVREACMLLLKVC